MAAQKRGGSVINLASIFGLVGYDYQLYQGTQLQPPIAYSAIKSGIINLTRTLASYFGKDQIRVNALCPGGVFNHQENRFVKNYSTKAPLGRMAIPEEIACAALFLAGSASSYITGSTLVVDGGWTAI
jgi:NAD(P)-dependent dehydrogenase (short-subunit alcohol dehydrogenase family)